MTDTLESLHQEFAAYRQLHRRGAYPMALRRRAMLGLTQGELLQLGARLGLTAEQVGRWNPPAERQQIEAQEFFEVPVGRSEPGDSGLRIEVQLGNGVILRVLDQVDTKALRMLVTALQVGTVAA